MTLSEPDGSSPGGNPLSSVVKLFGFSILLLSVTPITLLSRQSTPTPLPSRELPPSKSLCYAFLREGDVWTVCGGKREHIVFGGEVLHYAVSSDGSYFAFLSKPHQSRQGAPANNNLVLISLGPGFETTRTQTEFRFLRPTCGTILAFRAGSGDATDVFTGRVLNFPPDRFFRCSSDRRVIVGWAELNATSSELIVTMNGKEEKRVPIFINGGHDFNVSPNGQYLTYFRATGSQTTQVCVAKIDDGPACVQEDGDEVGMDGISLSNLGEVLYTGHTGQGCYYKDMEHFSKTRLPGYSGEDSCVGVYFWHSRSQHPTLIEDLARYPQWITPEAAIALHNWNLKGRTH